MCFLLPIPLFIRQPEPKPAAPGDMEMMSVNPMMKTPPPPVSPKGPIIAGEFGSRTSREVAHITVDGRSAVVTTNEMPGRQGVEVRAWLVKNPMTGEETVMTEAEFNEYQATLARTAGAPRIKVLGNGRASMVQPEVLESAMLRTFNSNQPGTESVRTTTTRTISSGSPTMVIQEGGLGRAPVKMISPNPARVVGPGVETMTTTTTTRTLGPNGETVVTTQQGGGTRTVTMTSSGAMPPPARGQATLQFEADAGAADLLKMLDSNMTNEGMRRPTLSPGAVTHQDDEDEGDDEDEDL